MIEMDARKMKSIAEFVLQCGVWFYVFSNVGESVSRNINDLDTLGEIVVMTAVFTAWFSVFAVVMYFLLRFCVRRFIDSLVEEDANT